MRDLGFGGRGLDPTAPVDFPLYKMEQLALPTAPYNETYHETTNDMNISMPIVAAPRSRAVSSSGGRGLRYLTARLAQAMTDSGLMAAPVSRAVDAVNSVLSAKPDTDKSCHNAAQRPSLLTRRRRSLRLPPILPLAPERERESAPEDRLPSPPVFGRMPALRHPRPRRIIDRAQMAADAFALLEAQVQHADTPESAHCDSVPPYPFPRRRRHDCAATHVANMAPEDVEIPPPKSCCHDGSARRDLDQAQDVWASAGDGPCNHSHECVAQLGRGADAGGAARREHARN